VKRRIVNTVPMLLAALSLYVVAGWIWSYGRGATLKIEGGGFLPSGQSTANINNGSIRLWWSRPDRPMLSLHALRTLTQHARWQTGTWFSRPSESLKNLVRFGCDPGWYTGSVLFPCWMPAMLLAAVPAWLSVRRLRRGRKIAAGLCAVCGYDLRATPDRCPECGHAPAEAAA
jgi:hypothetical protein